MNAIVRKLRSLDRRSDSNLSDANYRNGFASRAMNYASESDCLDDCDHVEVSVPHIYQRADSHKIVCGRFAVWHPQR